MVAYALEVTPFPACSQSNFTDPKPEHSSEAVMVHIDSDCQLTGSKMTWETSPWTPWDGFPD